MSAAVAIERLAGLPADFDARYRAPCRPVIASGALAGWKALDWTPEWFNARYGDIESHASVQLPQTGVVYQQTEKAHRQTLKVRELVQMMQCGTSCYLDQADVGHFPGLLEGSPVPSLVPAGRHFVNLWIGARTRSGLHYDPMDNCLLQLHGSKVAILAAPADRRNLYPFADNVAKSRIDPEAPDAARFPRVQEATLFTGELAPGDLLYIPRGWWHFLRAPASSISLNLWHEPALTLGDELRGLAELGPACWARTARDFLWHGLLRRPYEQRLYSPPPTGKQLYDLCAMGIAGRPLP